MEPAVLAHVKWFSEFDFTDPPRSFSEVLTPTFFALAALAMTVIGAMVFIDRRLDDVGWYGRINSWLSDRAEYSTTVIRVAMAAVLLISWENRALLTPELAEPQAWVGWMQFVLALLLLFPRSAPAAGIGIIFLWVIGLGEYGPLHMLDYLHYVGIGIYLFVSASKDEKIRGIGLPALYLTIGFALIWLGFEKLVYPEWSLLILEENPNLVLGLPPDFFLQGAAFVEISLGFLLIIGLLERPLAAVITLVFFTTTLVFGRVEVIGHTPLHAALVVFLLNGPGSFYKPPIALHRRIWLRVSFAVVNFAFALALVGFVYSLSAQLQFEEATVSAAQISRAHGPG
ncbi:DoxX family membrane protein [Euzebya tangerina]|uniref:DoxX family membrane protein n=1 Tax=Euzebya tangerina TaxID=591198 RepID=UPI000E31D615|nr:DoxX family membrane protein [Euzebya tangerina]